MSSDSSSEYSDDSLDSSAEERYKELNDLTVKYGDIHIFKDIVWNVSDEPSKARKIKAELMKENESSYRFAASMIVLSESYSFDIQLKSNSGQQLNIFDPNLDMPVHIFGNKINITYRTVYPDPADADFDRKFVFDEGYEVVIEYVANGELFTYYEILKHIYDFYKENSHILAKFDKKELEFTGLSCRNWPPVDSIPKYVVYMKLKN